MEVRFTTRVCATGGGIWEPDTTEEVSEEMGEHLLRIGAAERVEKSKPQLAVPEQEEAPASPAPASKSKRNRKG